MGCLSDRKMYSIQRGTIAFQPTGENGYLDMGNAPSLNINIDIEKYKHYSSRSGLSNMDMLIITRQDIMATFNLDETNIDTLNLWFMADGVTTTVQSALTAQTVYVTAYVGRWVQIGRRNLSSVVVKSQYDSTTYTVCTGSSGTGDCEVKLKPGWLYVPATGSNISDGEVLKITFNQAATTDRRIDAGQSTTIYGDFAFWGDPPKGTIYEIYGYGSLTADGDFPFITDNDIQNYTFTMEFQESSDYEGTIEVHDTGTV